MLDKNGHPAVGVSFKSQALVKNLRMKSVGGGEIMNAVTSSDSKSKTVGGVLVQLKERKPFEEVETEDFLKDDLFTSPNFK